MYRVVVLGHSLVPRSFDSIPSIDIEVYRKPGGLWLDIETHEFIEFWTKEFDLAILVLGEDNFKRSIMRVVNGVKHNLSVN